ncbi:lantibiotic dehydratase [Chitinophaga sp. Mgbs1]|uniref:Lantibiotic dehydratase n=1 Tax=Chitinophaga solisilvae TaxID=1233460 RepID=A0A3S1CX99_9BACT|nr:lantibiotic dehydratase [Chitinophaga solisilvae]
MIQSENYYVVRTPLLPVNIHEQLRTITPATLAGTIKEIYTDNYLKEAIYIASPELYQELHKWLQGTITQEKDIRKLAFSLYRYLLRMSSRCTPYGLFAGCATGAPADHTAILLQSPEAHKKHARLDMNYVAELAAAITGIPEIKAQLLFYPNNSLYETGSRYRYAAYAVKNKFRNYYLTAVNRSAYLDCMLETARNGATLTDIRNSIMEIDEDITEEEAAEFTEELVSNQLLVSELEPTVTGEEFFSNLLHRLQQLQHTEAFTTPLSRIQQLLSEQQTGTEKYYAIHELVKAILNATSNKDLVQTDLFLATTENTLSTQLINDITTQVSALWKLARVNPNSDLQDFITAFSTRYEEQEIPLNLALDTEAGIGYGSHTNSSSDHTPLLDDIYPTPGGRAQGPPRSKMMEFQLQQLHECLRQRKKEIVLTEQHLEELKEQEAPTLPYSMYLMGSILGSSAAAIDAGDYLFDMNGCSGPSSANLLGRFCHGDERLQQLVKESLAAEEAQEPEKIYAEIIHLPESRTGNILMRPRLRSHEIVYLANTQAPANFQLPADDLMVSIQRGKIMLRSRRLNKIIVPRMSTAHNYRNGLPIYKFLCDLQYQGYQAGISWQWQTDDSFLPRVRYGKLLLSKSTWKLRKKDYPALEKSSPETFAGIFAGIREQLELPRHVVIVEGDNELLIDMECPAAIQLLADNLLKKDQLTLQEFLSTAENCWIESAAGRHTNEFIFPLHTTVPATAIPSADLTEAPEMPVRQFFTGSEWLYVKIYCGTRSAESILREVIRPLAQTLQEEGITDSWFFIRYTDPEHHLRVRFHHGEHPLFWQEVLNRLYQAIQEFQDKDAVYRIQTDTYQREIERYGAATMALSEEIFCFDSEAVVNIIDLLEEEEGENYRWPLAVRGVDELLNDFGYTLREKSLLLQQLQKGFYEEFGGGKQLLVQLNDKYRQEMRKVGSFLDPAQDADNGIGEATAFFGIRSEKITAALAQHGPLPNRYDLLPSYIHMFLNRTLLSNQRKHELVIYHFLSRYYESSLAKQKKLTT